MSDDKSKKLSEEELEKVNGGANSEIDIEKPENIKLDPEDNIAIKHIIGL